MDVKDLFDGQLITVTIKETILVGIITHYSYELDYTNMNRRVHRLTIDLDYECSADISIEDLDIIKPYKKEGDNNGGQFVLKFD